MTKNMLSWIHKATEETEMNNVKYNNFDHNIDYKFSHGASLSVNDRDGI